MASGIYNIEVEQGASFQFEVDIDGNSDFDTNFNTNAISYVGTIRDKYSDSSAGAKFTIAKTQSNNGASPPVYTNKITLSLTDTQTAALTSGKQYWDLLHTDTSPNPDERKRILQGNVIVTPQVTRHDD